MVENVRVGEVCKTETDAHRFEEGRDAWIIASVHESGVESGVKRAGHLGPRTWRVAHQSLPAPASAFDVPTPEIIIPV